MKELGYYSRFYYYHHERAMESENDIDVSVEITSDEYLRRRQSLISLGIAFCEEDHGSFLCLHYYTRNLNK